MRVLIAEDDLISARVLAKALETLGYEVAQASDGEAAWQRLQQERSPLVITDWMMPGMDGIELCRRIRSRPGPYTYVILLTARDNCEDRQEALRIGADDFLTKPLDRNELAARLQVAQRILNMQAELEQRAVRLETLHGVLERRNEQLAEANLRLQNLATTDGLTCLANHRSFQERFGEEIERARRQNLPLTLLLMDIDHFKHYNDTYGHPAGDEVLRIAAQQIRQLLREEDVAARYGGEEFVVMLPGLNTVAAHALAERIRLAVASYPFAHRAVTLSIGLAERAAGSDEPTSLLTRADAALYAAKRAGRNCVVMADSEPHRLTERRGAPLGVSAASLPQQRDGHISMASYFAVEEMTWGGWEGLLQDPAIGLLSNLLGVLELRASKSPGHSQVVIRFALWLAQACMRYETVFVTPGDLRELAFGALLHDIGNLCVPEAILHKRGELDAYEVS